LLIFFSVYTLTTIRIEVWARDWTNPGTGSRAHAWNWIFTICV